MGFGAFAIFGILTTVLNSLGRERASASPRCRPSRWWWRSASSTCAARRSDRCSLAHRAGHLDGPFRRDARRGVARQQRRRAVVSPAERRGESWPRSSGRSAARPLAAAAGQAHDHWLAAVRAASTSSCSWCTRELGRADLGHQADRRSSAGRFWTLGRLACRRSPRARTDLRASRARGDLGDSEPGLERPPHDLFTAPRPSISTTSRSPTRPSVWPCSLARSRSSSLLPISTRALHVAPSSSSPSSPAHHDLPLAQNRHAIAHRLDVAQDVRREEDGATVLPLLEDRGRGLPCGPPDRARSSARPKSTARDRPPAPRRAPCAGACPSKAGAPDGPPRRRCRPGRARRVRSRAAAAASPESRPHSSTNSAGVRYG